MCGRPTAGDRCNPWRNPPTNGSVVTCFSGPAGLGPEHDTLRTRPCSMIDPFEAVGLPVMPACSRPTRQLVATAVRSGRHYPADGSDAPPGNLSGMSLAVSNRASARLSASDNAFSRVASPAANGDKASVSVAWCKPECKPSTGRFESPGFSGVWAGLLLVRDQANSHSKYPGGNLFVAGVCVSSVRLSFEPFDA
jgi:hypothetical protein